MTERTCENCAWWAVREVKDRPGYVYATAECRRYPKQVAGNLMSGQEKWPETRSSDWCGEHKERG